MDELVTSPAWKKLHVISAEEGLIALAYERKHSQWRYHTCMHVVVCSINYMYIGTFSSHS